VAREVQIREQTIRLGQLLKLAGVVGSGSEAKALLASVPLTVNGEPETRRGRKLHDGDVVRVQDEELVVSAAAVGSPILHPLAAGFVDVADSYERGRPEYTLAAAQALVAELHIAPGGRVLDLAAGTGKLTRALLGVGLDVIAVEPQAQLREILSASVGAERVLGGVAEEIPLPDASVAAVTVADAFHWFDHAAALEEIQRVLISGGGLAVLRILPDWSGASWAHEVGTLIAELRPAHPQFEGPGWQQAALAAGCWTPPRELQLTMVQPAELERVLDYIASMSWMAALPEDRREATITRIGEIINAGEMPDGFPVHVIVGLTSLA
jgi:ribosome-associated protein YbcJ (S4-like RNA binding protein)/SAM-dependent methyltransferase